MKENQSIEWKESWHDEYLKWLCGFANAEGGTLVIGKNDKGVAVGISNAAKLLEDLPNKIRDVLGESNTVLLNKLHLNEGPYLKRAAVLLFHGSLFTQVAETMDRLFGKYLTASISYEGVQRVETYPAPEATLREAILNAIAHKDYASGTPIQISVYDDKLLVWNPGRLPPDWTIANLAEKHASLPYNPDVANAFFRAGMIESWGQGFERIYSSCQAAGVPRPQLRYEATGLWVEFTWTNRTVRESPDEHAQQTLGKTLGKTPDLILELLSKDAHLTVELLAHHLSKSESAVNRAILKLQSQGLLHREGSRKAGHWKVITPKRN
jgi:ATP-dependent DNA helicase RecG